MAPSWLRDFTVLAKLSKDPTFYDLLQQQAQVAVRASQAFVELQTDFGNLWDWAAKIDLIEHEGDELARKIGNKLASTFITPLDKEDIRELSHELDNITDYIEAAVARANLYKLTVVRPDLAPLAALLLETSKIVYEAVTELASFHKSDTLGQRLLKIHQLENESDHAFRTALADLFDEPGADPLTVIKWKEVYDRIEKAIDSCEDVAKVLGDVLVKYA
jgi:predicted phosphate transport protein (TIGR00153 family)